MNHTLGTFQVTPAMQKGINQVLRSGWLSPGPKVQKFETKFANLHKNEFGIMVNSGTDALRIALFAMKELYDWKDGDQIICPSVTFVATLNTILQAGLRPFLVDVGMKDFCINPDNILRRMPNNHEDRSRIKAILPVHIAGNATKMPILLGMAKDFGWKIIEDSCEAMGNYWIGKGDVACFSFYMAHLLTTGVGGMAITNDKNLREVMWSYANHGRRAEQGFVFDRIGYSSRATEFEAALGLAQLPKLPEIIAKRRSNAHYLYLKLRLLDGIYVDFVPDSSCMFFPVVLSQSSRIINKWNVMNRLTKAGIENRELLPLINQPCYKGLIRPDSSFSVADWINRSGFYIGCHEGLTTKRLDQTIEVFRGIFSELSSKVQRVSKEKRQAVGVPKKLLAAH
jgi:perosamine synthetase